MSRQVASAVAVALMAGGSLAACGSDDPGADAPGPTVVASTTQVADLTRQVTGERADVVGLLSPASDPHEYEPRPSDAESIAQAALVVESGGDVDLWMDELVESSGSDAPVLTLLDTAETLDVDGETDPHWWQSAANAVLATEAIRDALTEADPDGAGEYARNADRFVAELNGLDREISRCIDSIPPGNRELVTSHDSLGYFTDRYGLTVVGSTIPALTTQAQPSAGDIDALVALIRERDVAAVFGEAGVSTELEQTVADETGAEVGAELHADALGEEGSPAGTYAGAMRENATAIADALGGDPAACAGESP